MAEPTSPQEALRLWARSNELYEAWRARGCTEADWDKYLKAKEGYDKHIRDVEEAA